MGLEPLPVTFVAESPAAAAALQRELGGAVRVVADGAVAAEEGEEDEEAQRQRWMAPPLLTLVLPGTDVPRQMLEPSLGLVVVTQSDYEAAYEEQVGGRR